MKKLYLTGRTIRYKYFITLSTITFWSLVEQIVKGDVFPEIMEKFSFVCYDI